MALELIKTPYELLLEEAGYPRMQAGGRPPSSSGYVSPTPISRAATQDGLSGIGSVGPLVDMTAPNPVSFYRPNPQNKFGAKDKLETLPSRVDKTTMQDFIRAMRAGEKLGVPQLPPEYLAALLMQEGRSDFGFNEMNMNNPKAKMIAEQLMQEGFNDTAAGFSGALYDKMQTAMRLKKPFSTVWNGTGVSMYGQSGDQYTNKFTQGFPATMHPKNAELLNSIREAYDQKLQTQQAPENNMPTVDQMGSAFGYNAGGAAKPKTFHDISKLLIQKHLGK